MIDRSIWLRGLALSWPIACIAIQVPGRAEPQTFAGKLSDSHCGASHQQKAGGASDRACLFACVNALAKYVLVDQRNQVIEIANQDAMGLPLYAGRPVRVTGELKDRAIVITKVEAIPAHLHIGHVMTNFRDTPGNRGFLPVAVEEAKVAAQHAILAAKSDSLGDIRLHAGHVIHALDPAVEAQGPGAGYGVKKATAGALQHLDLAGKAEGTTPTITTHGARVSASLASVLDWTAQALALAARVRTAPDAAEARTFANDLAVLTTKISGDGLQPAQREMELMLAAEGLTGMPR